ncbi:sulfate/molybdate ABC transporter ATP-binding protein [Caminibacter sp.]
MIIVNVKKKLHGSSGQMWLDVGFEIKRGEFLAITGKSGSGKTTLLRIIAGLEKAEGKIKVGDEIWLDDKKFLPPQKREIGFLFQNYALFPNMTVLENLLYVKKDKKFALKLLETADIKELKNRYPSTLSGGQKQRVALCRALMRKPKLLLLDEPFSALDIEMRDILHREIAFFHNEFNLTTIMVSHSLSEIYKLSQKVILLENGKIKKTGKPSEVLINSSSSEKFSLIGEIVDIKKNDIINIAVLSIGNRLIEVVLSSEETEGLKKGDRVNISAKAFFLNIKKERS